MNRLILSVVCIAFVSQANLGWGQTTAEDQASVSAACEEQVGEVIAVSKLDGTDVEGDLVSVLKGKNESLRMLTLRVDKRTIRIKREVIDSIVLGGAKVQVATEVELEKAELDNCINRGKEFLRSNSGLSSSQYRQLFSGACGQGNVANCYMLSGFGALPLAHREGLMRASLRQQKDGCRVSFPLGVSEPKSEVLVRFSDIAPQIIGKEKLDPVDSSLGWQILEAAYILHKFGRDNQGQVNRKASGGGSAPRVITDIVPSTPSTMSVAFPDGDLTGKQENVAQLLSGARAGVHMMTASSLHTKGDYEIAGVKLTGTHAYVVIGFQKESGLVALLNPHNSTKPLMFTVNDFCRGFRAIHRVEIDLDKLYK